MEENKVRWLIAFLLCLGFVPLKLHAQSLSIKDCQSVIEKYEKLFEGRSVEFQSVFDKTEFNQPYKLSISDTGNFTVNWEFPYSHVSHESSFADGQLLISSYNDADKKNHMVHGYIDLTTHPSMYCPMLPIIFGVSSSDGKRFSELISRENAELKVSSKNAVTDHVGEICLTAMVPRYGQYKFWIDDRERVVAIEVKKSEGDFLIGANKQLKVIGATEASQESKTHLVDLENRLENIRYDENGFPSSFDLISRTKASDGTELVLPNRIEINSIETLDWGFTEDLHFNVNHVSDGIRVQIDGHEDEAYEFRDGKLLRVVDSDSVNEIDGVRVRKSQGNLSYYLTITASILIVLGVLFYAKRHGN